MFEQFFNSVDATITTVANGSISLNHDGIQVCSATVSEGGLRAVTEEPPAEELLRERVVQVGQTIQIPVQDRVVSNGGGSIGTINTFKMYVFQPPDLFPSDLSYDPVERIAEYDVFLVRDESEPGSVRQEITSNVGIQFWWGAGPDFEQRIGDSPIHSDSVSIVVGHKGSSGPDIFTDSCVARTTQRRNTPAASRSSHQRRMDTANNLMDVQIERCSVSPMTTTHDGLPESDNDNLVPELLTRVNRVPYCCDGGASEFGH